MREDISKLTKAQLLELAARRKVKAVSSMKKDEIVKAIEKAKAAAKKKAKTAAAKKKAAAGKPKAAPGKKSAAGKAARPAEKKRARAAAKPAAKKKAPEAAPASEPKPGKNNWDINLEGKKFFVAEEVEDFPPPEPGEAPESCADNRIVALARDPRHLYVYWETNPGLAEKARQALGGKGWEKLRWTLRVHDVTGVEPENASRVFDVAVERGSGSAYVDVGRPDSEYIVSIGIMDDEGGFEAVAVSGRAMTPRESASPETDAEWMVPAETLEKLYGISGGGAPGESSLGLGGSELGMGASELSVPMEEISSGAVSSFGASEEFLAKAARERGFFFWLNCELVVYGGTMPDATVTLKGERIKLRPDGTFSVRFSLPDGVLDIPVIAESAAGAEKKEISPTVTRTTSAREARGEKAGTR